MPKEESGPPARSSSWADWLKPARWLGFLQRVVQVEKSLQDLRAENIEHAERIRELERALDYQGGQLAELDRYIEVKVAFEVAKQLDRRIGKKGK